MLAIARQKLPDSVKLQTGEANELPFPEHHFDLVISTSVFHYFQNPEKVLQEITRVLKPQGCLILTDWCRNYLMINLLDRWLHWVDKAHVRAYSIDDLQKILIESNFKLLSIDQYRINWFWGLMTYRQLEVISAYNRVWKKALQLQPDLTLVVGNFGNESLALAPQVLLPPPHGMAIARYRRSLHPRLFANESYQNYCLEEANTRFQRSCVVERGVRLIRSYLELLAIRIKLLSCLRIWSTGLAALLLSTGLAACSGGSDKVVNIYSSRHYNQDDELYKAFTDKTGIQVNVIEGKDAELIERIQS
nr:membrane-associated protein [Synechococcus sp.]